MRSDGAPAPAPPPWYKALRSTIRGVIWLLGAIISGLLSSPDKRRALLSEGGELLVAKEFLLAAALVAGLTVVLLVGYALAPSIARCALIWATLGARF